MSLPQIPLQVQQPTSGNAAWNAVAALDEMIAQFDQFYADAKRSDNDRACLGSGYFWEWAKRGRQLKAALEASSPTKTLEQVEQIPSEGDTRTFLKDMGLKEVAPHIWEFPKRTTYQ